jgi:hypothetical protein
LDCGRHEIIRPVIMQDKSYVKVGENIKITAGICMFSINSDPQITVNGKPATTEYGIASYNLKASLKAGGYSVPVKMEYIKPDGTKNIFIKNIEYTVIDPNQNPQ